MEFSLCSITVNRICLVKFIKKVSEIFDIPSSIFLFFPPSPSLMYYRCSATSTFNSASLGCFCF